MGLCFLSGLTSSEWAAWFQAGGSIVAIIAAAGIAIWQSKKQHESALTLHKEERRYERVELTKTLVQLARNCEKVSAHFIAELNNDRTNVHDIAEGRKHLDLEQLVRVERAVSNIPLHSLPEKLVTHTMVLSATVRQFLHKLESAFRNHRQMDAANFDDLFRTTAEMRDTLGETVTDIEAAIRT